MTDSFVLTQLAKVITRVMRLDPEVKTLLAPVQQRTLVLDITGSPGPILVNFHEDGLTLTPYQEDEHDKPNLTLSGSAFDFLTLAKGQDPKAMRHITIEGDTELATELQQLTTRFDIDWEEQVAKLTGDVIAHRLGKAFNKLKNACSQTRESMCDNVSEYVHHEIKLAPHPYECEKLYQDIDQCRLDTERLLAKWKKRVNTHES